MAASLSGYEDGAPYPPLGPARVQSEGRLGPPTAVTLNHLGSGRSSYRPLRCGLHVDRRGQTAAAKGTVRTVHLAKEDHDVVWVRSCRL
jgi:hypothetical protein